MQSKISEKNLLSVTTYLGYFMFELFGPWKDIDQGTKMMSSLLTNKVRLWLAALSQSNLIRYRVLFHLLLCYQFAQTAIFITSALVLL